MAVLFQHVCTYLQQQLAEMDPDDILAKQVEQLEKEKRELQEKLKSQEKKVSGSLLFLKVCASPLRNI